MNLSFFEVCGWLCHTVPENQGSPACETADNQNPGNQNLTARETVEIQNPGHRSRPALDFAF